MNAYLSACSYTETERERDRERERERELLLSFSIVFLTLITETANTIQHAQVYDATLCLLAD